MNQLRLGHCLGAVSSAGYQRFENERRIYSLEHQEIITFNFIKSTANQSIVEETSQTRDIAHQAGVNCLTIDNNDGRYLISGGADSSVRLWDLESTTSITTSKSKRPPSSVYTPHATLSKADRSSHTHAITSISIYPFDPTPTTLLTTSYDKSLKLTSITPSSLTPVHTFQLDFAPYTHSVSPNPDSSPLVAVGTAHPAVRLLDLRSGLSTHSLPGQNGAIYALAWSPRYAHVLASGSHDGRVLFFDIRRANAAYASLDLDDALGVTPTTLTHHSSTLNFSARAHAGPVTSIQFHPTSSPSSNTLITAGHDQRIRVWDISTGRNELVHFGPRIRNERIGNLSPLISPVGSTLKPSREVLFWPNDDGKGDIYMHSLREGNLIRILRTKGVDRATAARGKSSGGGATAGKTITSTGRINQLCLRRNASHGEGIEMYSAHGDGKICAWMPNLDDGEDDEDEDESKIGNKVSGISGATTADDERENKRKRKRELLNDLVQGLTKKPVTFGS